MKVILFSALKTSFFGGHYLVIKFYDTIISFYPWVVNGSTVKK